MIEEIKVQIQSHQRVMDSIGQELSPKIAAVVELLSDALSNGKKLLVMGNGGSAADAQHFVAELVGRFKMERQGLPAIALTTDTSILTAVGNDYGFEDIFTRQVGALARPGDVVVGISTSGSSKNVHKALLLADERGCRTIGLLGKDGGTIAGIVDVPLTVPCDDTPRIQEGHITIIHILCDLLEKRLFSGAPGKS
ncbi:D-sedoheptulose 7-phosphate isomerase [Geotalea sp. SG265]|uniref:D-sedoheptulose 7-phosphate isomerase n=1 Tax=Geotalea sp. SG265 TaxID=2922867 RepID=UPI001FAECEF1|nr:D-sedoheptulose 7-phosphate isomerase [Geotalea sp. SG265]